MAVITKFQLKELKREVWFQLNRVSGELAIVPAAKRARLVGMLKTQRRLQLLLSLLAELERDGYLQLVENDTEVVDHVRDSAGVG